MTYQGLQTAHMRLTDAISHLRRQRDAHQMDEPEYIEKVLETVLTALKAVRPKEIGEFEISLEDKEYRRGYNEALADSFETIERLLGGEKR